MILKTAKGTKEYKIKDFDFTNVMCDLEDRGVDIMKMMSEDGLQDGKVFTTMRAITAALIGVDDPREAGKILSEHLKNGGDINVIFNAFTEVMESAGFGETAKKSEKTEETAEE